MSDVIIGNARISEYGTVTGKVGDQTGKEVMLQPWDTGGTWTYVFRPISVSVANKIATCMEWACKTDKAGYNWYGDEETSRTSLYHQMVKNGWKISKILPCNTDCSALVSVCCNYAGVKVSKDMCTSNELALLKATEKFYIYASADYTRSPNKLARGDILLRKGHTAVVTQGAVTRTGKCKVKMLKNVKIRNKAKKFPLSKKLGVLKKGKTCTISRISKNGRFGKLDGRDGWIALKNTKKV